MENNNSQNIKEHTKCKPYVKPLEIETTPSEPSTVDTENTYEPLIMVFDVEHTGCKEQLIIQLSWGMYKQDGTLVEMNDYYLEPTDYIYIYISPRASDKHHITFEALLHNSNKLKLETLLNELMTDLTNCKTLVVHNMKNDLSTSSNELLRCDMINIIVMNTFAQWHKPKHIVIVKRCIKSFKTAKT